MMYAFLLRKRMKRSRHQKQHFRQQSRKRAGALLEPRSFWSRYSRNTRTSCTTARRRAPNAREPVWYLGVGGQGSGVRERCIV